jgi:multidrug efflux pump
LPALAVYGGLLYLTYLAFQTTPTGFIPTQDKGYLLVNVRLPDSASLERTNRMMQDVELAAAHTPGVRHTLAIAGQSLVVNARAPNFGTLYVMLDDFADRSAAGHTAESISRALEENLSSAVQDGVVHVFGAPPIEGLGMTGGFSIVVEDRGDLGLATLQDVSAQIVSHGEETPGLSNLFSSFRGDTTWLHIDIDRDAAKRRGVSLAELFSTLQVNFGSLYVNDFNRFGRTWQVNVQADDKFRMSPDDLKRMYVRNDSGEMVPLASLATLREISGPLLLVRYNLYPAAVITANAAPGASSGQAIDQLQEVANANLVPRLRAEWTELALLQQGVGRTAVFSFLLAVVLVFLVLAAQYESWSLPLAVILVVPMCLLCSIAGVQLAAMDVNIFTQIGFVVLVGLACKNAILIVEFARARHVAGATIWEATLEACQLRLRPIIMTSLAFVFGVVPLLYGHGAGAEMRRTLGTAVFAGMLGVTLFGIFLTPVFFFVIQWLTDKVRSLYRSPVQPEEHAY